MIEVVIEDSLPEVLTGFDRIAFSREKTEAHILSRLARYKAPAYYVLYESFPLLANGKVDMVTLKKDVASRRGTEAAL